MRESYYTENCLQAATALNRHAHPGWISEPGHLCGPLHRRCAVLVRRAAARAEGAAHTAGSLTLKTMPPLASGGAGGSTSTFGLSARLWLSSSRSPTK